MATKRLYSVIVGARNGRASISLRDEREIQRITLQHFPSGCSILEVSGMWADPSKGTFRREKARQIMITTGEPQKLDRWARQLGRFMAQKELLMVEVGKAKSVRIRAV